MRFFCLVLLGLSWFAFADEYPPFVSRYFENFSREQMVLLDRAEPSVLSRMMDEYVATSTQQGLIDQQWHPHAFMTLSLRKVEHHLNSRQHITPNLASALGVAMARYALNNAKIPVPRVDLAQSDTFGFAGYLERRSDLGSAFLSRLSHTPYALLNDFSTYQTVEDSVFRAVFRVYLLEAKWPADLLMSYSGHRHDGLDDQFLGEHTGAFLRQEPTEQGLNVWLSRFREPQSLGVARELAFAWAKTPELKTILFRRMPADAKDDEPRQSFSQRHWREVVALSLKPAAVGRFAVSVPEATNRTVLDFVVPTITNTKDFFALFSQTPTRRDRILFFAVPAEYRRINRAAMWRYVEEFLRLKPTYQEARAFIQTNPAHPAAAQIYSYVGVRMIHQPIRHALERERLQIGVACARWFSL